MFYTEPNWTYRFSQNQLDADCLYPSIQQIERFCPESLPQMRKSRKYVVLSMKKNCSDFQSNQLSIARIQTTDLKTIHY